jgi:CRISPR/Cas system CMR subunit Cmr6 (Cas7 group RAMP superfamily)
MVALYEFFVVLFPKHEKRKQKTLTKRTNSIKKLNEHKTRDQNWNHNVKTWLKRETRANNKTVSNVTALTNTIDVISNKLEIFKWKGTHEILLKVAYGR